MSVIEQAGAAVGAYSMAKKIGSGAMLVAAGVLVGILLKGCIEGEKISKKLDPIVTERIDTLWRDRWYPFVIRQKNVPGTNITDSTFDAVVDTVSPEGDSVRIDLTADKRSNRLSRLELLMSFYKPTIEIFVTRDCTHTVFIPTETTVLIDNQWVLFAGTLIGVLLSVTAVALF